MEISPFYKLKSLFVGQSSCGKSSLVHLIRHDIPAYKTEPTIGMGFACTQFELEEYPLSNPSKLPHFYSEAKKNFPINVSNKALQLVQIQCWDCSGQARYFAITSNYMRDVDICFLVFDITDRSSWDQLPMWREKVLSFSRNEKLPLFILVGTKSDLKNHQISLDEIKQRSEEWKIKNYILSAVQESSSSMLKRMLYKSIQDFHDLMLLIAHEGKELPQHVTLKNFVKRIPIIDLSVESNPGYCCIIS